MCRRPVSFLKQKVNRAGSTATSKCHILRAYKYSLKGSGCEYIYIYIYIDFSQLSDLFLAPQPSS